jgi:hypothetical protein
MSEFTFKTDEKSYAFMQSIVAEMMQQFSISRNEAVGRLNSAWTRMEIKGPDHVIYHEYQKFWANNMYYGTDSFWWLNPPDLKPLPYP